MCSTTAAAVTSTRRIPAGPISRPSSRSTACASSCGATYGPPRRSTGGRSPGFHCYDLDFTTAVFAAGRRNYVCNTVLVEHFSAGAYSYGWLEALETYHRKWAGRLPLGVEPLDGARLADLDRRAEAYFLKLLCQKRLFGACPFRRIVRYIRTYPGRAASWALPFKYLKYHLKSLVRHG